MPVVCTDSTCAVPVSAGPRMLGFLDFREIQMATTGTATELANTITPSSGPHRSIDAS
ncbi:Uncharacterised protein [Mycobacterium tuberculosis]|nr:Uncharacterised protein [Mycobacterium tuberculosis]